MEQMEQTTSVQEQLLGDKAPEVCVTSVVAAEDNTPASSSVQEQQLGDKDPEVTHPGGGH